MTLDEWVAEQKAALDTFAAMWRQGAKRDPEKYPMEMPPFEWDQQHRIDTE